MAQEKTEAIRAVFSRSVSCLAKHTQAKTRPVVALLVLRDGHRPLKTAAHGVAPATKGGMPPLKHAAFIQRAGPRKLLRPSMTYCAAPDFIRLILVDIDAAKPTGSTKTTPVTTRFETVRKLSRAKSGITTEFNRQSHFWTCIVKQIIYMTPMTKRNNPLRCVGE